MQGDFTGTRPPFYLPHLEQEEWAENLPFGPGETSREGADEFWHREGPVVCQTGEGGA